MPESGPYASAKAVDDAIKQAARNAAAVDSSVSVTDRIRQAYFDRFLCRVFSEGNTSQWLLKGGIGMLARVADSRARWMSTSIAQTSRWTPPLSSFVA